MKRQFLALVILILAISLFACANTDDKGNSADDPDNVVVTTTATQKTTTAAPRIYTVKFLDADMFGCTVINESQVKHGKPARSPKEPSHDGYVFVGWDVTDYSSITSDLEIYARYRPLDKYNVTFYDADGKAISETLTYTEGDTVVPPTIQGKIFLSCDENLSRIDRRWAQFARNYPSLPDDKSSETPIEYKVVAEYFDADAVIPYKENISMEFKETKNENGLTVYEPVDPIFSSSAAKFESENLKSYSTPGTIVDEKVYCTGGVSLAWDGEYIYASCHVYDPTLMTRGEEYVFAEINPAYNDTFELYYSFNVYPTKSTRRIAKVDAYGYKVFAAKNGEKSVYFDEIVYKHKMSKEANSYYIIYKIPAKTEAGAEMKAGDYVAVSNQINDLRSLEDVNNFFCSGGLFHYDTLWKFMLLGEK